MFYLYLMCHKVDFIDVPKVYNSGAGCASQYLYNQLISIQLIKLFANNGQMLQNFVY